MEDAEARPGGGPTPPAERGSRGRDDSETKLEVGLNVGGNPETANVSSESKTADGDTAADKLADDVTKSGSNATNKPVGEGVQDGQNGGTLLVNGKRKKIRRKQKGGSHHRRWKPYDKLTWEERQTLEERETKRACRKRESRFASGQAMAPYNTTQFLMEQHEPSNSEFNLDEGHPGREKSVSNRYGSQELGSVSVSGGSAEGSSEDLDSNDEEIFLEKDFTEAYEQYRAETLQNMSKEELVREHLQLEEEVESLKKQLKMAECANRLVSIEQVADGDIQTVQAIELLRQVKRLKEENERLRCENAQLSKQTVV